MSKSIRAKVRSQQAYNAEKIGNKTGLPPRVGKSLHSFLLLNKRVKDKNIAMTKTK